MYNLQKLINGDSFSGKAVNVVANNKKGRHFRHEVKLFAR